MPKEKQWSKLTHDERVAQITTLWNSGLSDAAIAKKLSATKGQIVGYRHLHIPTLTAATRESPGPPNPFNRTAATEPSIPPSQARQESNMQAARSHGNLIHEPDGEPSPGFLGRMTSDWQKQCGHVGDDNRQCGFHFTYRRGNEQRCNMHKDELN